SGPFLIPILLPCSRLVFPGHLLQCRGHVRPQALADQFPGQALEIFARLVLVLGRLQLGEPLRLAPADRILICLRRLRFNITFALSRVRTHREALVSGGLGSARLFRAFAFRLLSNPLPLRLGGFRALAGSLLLGPLPLHFALGLLPCRFGGFRFASGTLFLFALGFLLCGLRGFRAFAFRLLSNPLPLRLGGFRALAGSLLLGPLPLHFALGLLPCRFGGFSFASGTLFLFALGSLPCCLRGFRGFRAFALRLLSNPLPLPLGGFRALAGSLLLGPLSLGFALLLLPCRFGGLGLALDTPFVDAPGLQQLVVLQTAEVRIESGGVLPEEDFPGLLVAELLDQLVVAPLSFQIGRCGRWLLRRRNQGDNRTAQRAGVERLLPVGGALAHVIAHASQSKANVEPRFEQMVQQRSGVRAVFVGAILGDSARLCGVGDQRILVGRLD